MHEDRIHQIEHKTLQGINSVENEKTSTLLSVTKKSLGYK